MAVDNNTRINFSNAPTSVIGTNFRGPTASGADSVIQSIEDYQSQQASIEVMQFPLDRPKYFFIMSFQAYSRASLLDVRADLNTGQQVILPLPLGFADTHAISYDDVAFGSLGILGNAALESDAVQSVLNPGAATNATDDVAGAGGGATGGELAGELAAATAGAIAVGASAAAKVALGYSPNQFFTVILKGPQYKRHAFQWHLTPRTFQESVQIQKIIRFLNNVAAPGIIAQGGIFTFPLIVQCSFWPNFPYLYRFKPSVITRVSFNYTPSQTATFYHEQTTRLVDTTPTGANGPGSGGAGGEATDNPPESIIMQVELLELEYWLRNDFKDLNARADDTAATSQERASSGINGAPFSGVNV